MPGALIRVGNDYSFLEVDQEMSQLLWEKLRFAIKDRHFHPLVQSRQWDGMIEFYKKKTGRFLTGLLPEITAALHTKGYQVETVDKRTMVPFEVAQIDKDFLGNGFVLRDYQVDYVNQWIRRQTGIIPAPPGAGKSATLVALMKAMRPKTPALVIANRTDLIEQNYDDMVKYGVQNVGRFYGKVKEPNYITCCTVQSVEKLLPMLGKVRALVADEVHDLMTKQAKWLYTKIPNCTLRVGMSATPFLYGGRDLVQKFEVKGHFGPLLKTKFTSEASGKMTTKELQKREILSPAVCWFLPIKDPVLEYVLYNDAVTLGISENDYLKNVVADLAKKLTGRTLILVERIEQGDRLFEALGPQTEWVKGEDTRETRKRVITRLKEDENCLAIATRGIFNTGINVYCHNLINAAGGQADHLIIQRLGRGMRRADDKKSLHYFDFYFKNNEYLEKHSKRRIAILRKEGHVVQNFPTANLDDLPWGDVSTS